MTDKLQELIDKRNKIEEAGGAKRVQKQHDMGKLTDGLDEHLHGDSYNQQRDEQHHSENQAHPPGELLHPLHNHLKIRKVGDTKRLLAQRPRRVQRIVAHQLHALRGIHPKAAGFILAHHRQHARKL